MLICTDPSQFDFSQHYDCVAIRPLCGSYDETYYRDNGDCQFKGKYVVFQCTLEEFLSSAYKKIRKRLNPNNQFTLLMNDVHYYLGDLPEIPGVRMLISGLSFESVTGRYLLPLGEGEYSVYTKDGSSRINMRTNGTNHVYSHPNR